MSLAIIQERLDAYACTTAVEEEHALREITQDIILAALGRSDFFDHAGFHGGTCLRIFHSLNRFSEDLDFALLRPDPAFSLRPHLEKVRVEVEAYGYDLEVDDRSRVGQAMQMAFLKDASVGLLLHLGFRPTHGPMRKLRVKVEVDTNPPAGASYAMPVLDYPFPVAVRTFDLPSLFAGKVHALLCRAYLKGRDWYDFIWYTARRTTINHALLSAALDQTGPWAGHGIQTDTSWTVNRLNSLIETLDIERLREDVRPFIKPHEQPSLHCWSCAFFHAQCGKIPM